MLLRNREIRIEWIVFAVLTAGLIVVAALCGKAAVAVFACIVMGVFHFRSVWIRYRKLQSLAEDLDQLLTGGKQFPMQAYCEGELSVLGVQIQKMAVHLQEAADMHRNDKELLAESLADISHQLRTPLTAMNLTAAMLSAGELENQRRLELVKEMKQLLQRTQWLVEVLLKLSKLDAGTVKLEQITVESEKLIRMALNPLTIPMELREQQVVLSCQGAVTADLSWTAEALGNILKNAMENTPKGGKIMVTSVETPLFTQITVEDTGGGFCQEDLPHIFDRFYRVKKASADSYGIGLALARTIITRQNGTVQAENAHSGARFTVKLYKQIV